MTSELAEMMNERLNALTTSAPDIEFAFVFSTAGDMIAHSKLWGDKPPDLKAISPALAEMAVTSLELVQKLPLKEPPAKEPLFEHIVVLKASEGYIILMPINQRFWITSVVRYMAMLGLVFLDTSRAARDLEPMLASLPDS